MLAIIDSRSPKEAINNLKKEFNVLEFESNNITYNEVSGHPDIFINQHLNNIIIAPNSPTLLVDFLFNNKVAFKYGEKSVGKELNNSTQYNCIISDDYLFHKKNFTDNSIKEICKNNELVNLTQAYTRCSLTMINQNNFITSDKGIYNTLTKYNFNTLLVSHKNIMLPGFKNGFFGGTNGIINNKLYIIGNLSFHEDGDAIKTFLNSNNIELVELYNGKLYDGGGIFFIETEYL
ncbi:MAG: hypothetical protein KAG96_07985 [Ichthyobacteriaceae bacterium]|nr:hypothetical protein [Ichthyobacteriaceae bacterium]